MKRIIAAVFFFLSLGLAADSQTYNAASIGSELHLGEVGSNTLKINSPLVTSAVTVTTGKAIGALMTLANAARVSGTIGNSGTGGMIQSVTVTFTDAVAGNILDVIFFDANPSGSTCTNNAAFVLVTADRDKVIGIVHMSDFTSGGTPVVAQALNLALPYSLSSATSIYACVVARSSFAIASTANASLNTVVLRN